MSTIGETYICIILLLHNLPHREMHTEHKSHTIQVLMTGNIRNFTSTNWHINKGTLKGMPTIYQWQDKLHKREFKAYQMAHHTIWHTNNLILEKKYYFFKYTPSDLEDLSSQAAWLGTLTAWLRWTLADLESVAPAAVLANGSLATSLVLELRSLADWLRSLTA